MPEAAADRVLAADLLTADLGALLARARALRDQGHGTRHTYSPKVFLPLTRLCRNQCRYCTFVRPPAPGQTAYMTAEEVLAVARAGKAAGCTEALFTLGEKPERRYPAARQALAALGHDTTVSYLAEMAGLVLRETGLLPHVNAGTLDAAELRLLRGVSLSQGMMLESLSRRLCARGGPHYGSPDKAPEARLRTLRLAGELRIPFTTGLLIGIGETREERLEALFVLRDLHTRYGHIQEIILQNFRAKPGTGMAAAAEPEMDDLLWTAAAARVVLGPKMHIQVPPNLSDDAYPQLLNAGIDDWGGISPVTPDHVNPEAPWPQIEALRAATAAQGRVLAARLPLYPAYVADLETWADAALIGPTLALADGAGLAREDGWICGTATPPPAMPRLGRPAAAGTLARSLEAARRGDRLSESDVVRLFDARGDEFHDVCAEANNIRSSSCGSDVTYVVTRNINYTNICKYSCQFCAFSKSGGRTSLRGAAYDLDLDAVGRRAAEAWERGATEVCMQGGIHPRYTGETYLALCRAVRAAAPGIHIHAFSPLEVHHGAETLGLPVARFLDRLQAAGLGSLPGTAAEILDDEVRRTIAPDKLTTGQWLEVIAAAHGVGLATTSTIMFGHVDGYGHWARHLLALRDLQARTGGISEFVPLPFVPMQAPIALRGRARRGPTFREAVLMHAVGRLVLHPVLTNIQVSWTKMGLAGALRCLEAGANDLGGTLMDESISRSAGAEHGQELPPHRMEAAIGSLGRRPVMRTTLYGAAPPDRHRQAFKVPAGPFLGDHTIGHASSV
jgi:FO synthase